MNKNHILLTLDAVKKSKLPKSCRDIYNDSNLDFTYNIFSKSIKIVSEVFNIVDIRKISLGYKKGVKNIIYSNKK